MAGRHHSMDFDQSRSPAGSGLQVFYANQRHQARPNEAEQMAQAKRRMAAQRERELRNYHQEQQYNRSELSLMRLSLGISEADMKTTARCFHFGQTRPANEPQRHQ